MRWFSRGTPHFDHSREAETPVTVHYLYSKTSLRKWRSMCSTATHEWCREPGARSQEPSLGAWQNSAFQHELRSALLSIARRKAPHDGEDLVQEALTRTHARVLSAVQRSTPVHCPAALANKILKDLLVDHARRRKPLPLTEPDTVPHCVREPADHCLYQRDPRCLTEMSMRFPGRTQMAILDALATGMSLAEAANRLAMPAKELRRVAGNMARRLRILESVPTATGKPADTLAARQERFSR